MLPVTTKDCTQCVRSFCGLTTTGWLRVGVVGLAALATGQMIYIAYHLNQQPECPPCYTHDTFEDGLQNAARALWDQMTQLGAHCLDFTRFGVINRCVRLQPEL